MNIFKESAKFIGWLTGSIAGIGGLFYAAGYILVTSNLYLLGFDDLIGYSHEYYLHEGAEFYMICLLLAGETLLCISAFLAVVVSPFAIVLAVKRRTVIPWLKKGKLLLTDSDEQYSRWFRLVLITVAVLVFFHLLDNLEYSFAPTRIAGIVYLDAGEIKRILECDGPAGSEDSLKKWLVKADRKRLENHLVGLLLLVMESGILLYYVWGQTAQWGSRIVVRVPVATIFITYLSLLPMVYGVLIKDHEIFFMEPIFIDQGISMSGEFYLLNKNGREFLLWEADEKKLHWVSSSQLSRARIGSRESLLRVMSLQYLEEVELHVEKE
ncbi:MAG: hypothetical protein GY737_02370 [Desulfobacteraceae bacterium]|nr:hypothetical protein [Desulfobacteraceae bacterium]